MQMVADYYTTLRLTCKLSCTYISDLCMASTVPVRCSFCFIAAVRTTAIKQVGRSGLGYANELAYLRCADDFE